MSFIAKQNILLKKRIMLNNVFGPYTECMARLMFTMFPLDCLSHEVVHMRKVTVILPRLTIDMWNQQDGFPVFDSIQLLHFQVGRLEEEICHQQSHQT